MNQLPDRKIAKVVKVLPPRSTASSQSNGINVDSDTDSDVICLDDEPKPAVTIMPSNRCGSSCIFLDIAFHGPVCLLIVKCKRFLYLTIPPFKCQGHECFDFEFLENSDR